jgi:hypothetical protein
MKIHSLLITFPVSFPHTILNRWLHPHITKKKLAKHHNILQKLNSSLFLLPSKNLFLYSWRFEPHLPCSSPIYFPSIYFCLFILHPYSVEDPLFLFFLSNCSFQLILKILKSLDIFLKALLWCNFPPITVLSYSSIGEHLTITPHLSLPLSDMLTN